MSFKSYLIGFGIAVALVAPPDSARAAQDDPPNFSYLRDLKEISFLPTYEGMDDSKTVCLPTEENLTTAIQFVANHEIDVCEGHAVNLSRSAIGASVTSTFHPLCGCDRTLSYRVHDQVR
jgi:hypothetical protein